MEMGLDTHTERERERGGMMTTTKTLSELKKGEEVEEKKTKKTGGKCVKCRNRQLAISQFGTFGISFSFRSGFLCAKAAK